MTIETTTETEQHRIVEDTDGGLYDVDWSAISLNPREEVVNVTYINRTEGPVSRVLIRKSQSDPTTNTHRYKCGNSDCGESFDEHDRSVEGFEVCPVCGTTDTRPTGRDI